MKGNPAFINEFDLSPELIHRWQQSSNPLTGVKPLPVSDLSFIVQSLFTEGELAEWHQALHAQHWAPVGMDGIQSHYHEGDPIGSYRLSCFEEGLATVIWDRVKALFPAIRWMPSFTPSEGEHYDKWTPIGLNPLFRVIRYHSGGGLVPHYDAPFVSSDDVRTFSSCVIYLDQPPSGGATRFLIDPQLTRPLADRDYRDWSRMATSDEIQMEIHPHAGDALIFDHLVLHDSAPITSQAPKTIIRTDVMYRKVSS